MKYLLSITAILLAVSGAYADGLPQCYDVDGTPVRVIEASTRVPSPAYSTMLQGYPTIVFNDYFLDTVPNSRSVMSYIYLHECGHFALGHVDHPTESVAVQKERELQADCYAAKMIRRLDDEDGGRFLSINAVLKEVLTWPTDPEHPSGQVRARVIAACYQGQEG